MKGIMYMAMSANGYVATKDDETAFVSTAEWKSFDAMSKQAGNAIIGRRTYEVCLAGGQFPFPGRLNVVVSSRKLSHSFSDSVIFVTSPKEAFAVLQRRGYKTACIAGGGLLNASFLKAGLIDELYLDIEPVLLGSGVKLFAECDAELQLQLKEVRMISKNEVQLHYLVRR